MATQQISAGMIIKLDGSLYSVVELVKIKLPCSSKSVARLKGVDNITVP